MEAISEVKTYKNISNFEMRIAEKYSVIGRFASVDSPTEK
jgi:hypothetical protein